MNSTAPRRSRLQFSLKVWLFVVPTIAAFVFGYVSLTQQWERTIQQKQVQLAELMMQRKVAETERSQSLALLAAVDQKLDKFRGPEEIVRQTGLRLYGGGFANEENDLIYFERQATDDDLLELVRQLEAKLSSSSRAQVKRIIAYLDRLLLVASERREVIAQEVQTALESAQARNVAIAREKQEKRAAAARDRQQPAGAER
ncbi:hypothetical protein [Blastopirellula marina]|uniref:Uncharacterized protein n=1 Tax=Blastopirellula marina TaxID=124 RepID=A0A2S8GK64_9BACT|nr:hypothetical protein [Blastopirellula marina]PQO44839.1 hypothetical protein C5Y93_17245 [Blastopirellula marina]